MGFWNHLGSVGSALFDPHHPMSGREPVGAIMDYFDPGVRPYVDPRRARIGVGTPKQVKGLGDVLKDSSPKDSGSSGYVNQYEQPIGPGLPGSPGGTKTNPYWVGGEAESANPYPSAPSTNLFDYMDDDQITDYLQSSVYDPLDQSIRDRKGEAKNNQRMNKWGADEVTATIREEQGKQAKAHARIAKESGAAVDNTQKRMASAKASQDANIADTGSGGGIDHAERVKRMMRLESELGNDQNDSAAERMRSMAATTNMRRQEDAREITRDKDGDIQDLRTDASARADSMRLALAKEMADSQASSYGHDVDRWAAETALEQSAAEDAAEAAEAMGGDYGDVSSHLEDLLKPAGTGVWTAQPIVDPATGEPTGDTRAVEQMASTFDLSDEEQVRQFVQDMRDRGYDEQSILTVVQRHYQPPHMPSYAMGNRLNPYLQVAGLKQVLG